MPPREIRVAAFALADASPRHPYPRTGQRRGKRMTRLEDTAYADAAGGIARARCSGQRAESIASPRR